MRLVDKVSRREEGTLLNPMMFVDPEILQSTPTRAERSANQHQICMLEMMGNALAMLTLLKPS